jgi:hypothetical protein
MFSAFGSFIGVMLARQKAAAQHNALVNAGLQSVITAQAQAQPQLQNQNVSAQQNQSIASLMYGPVGATGPVGIQGSIGPGPTGVMGVTGDYFGGWSILSNGTSNFSSANVKPVEIPPLVEPEHPGVLDLESKPERALRD